MIGLTNLIVTNKYIVKVGVDDVNVGLGYLRVERIIM